MSRKLLSIKFTFFKHLALFANVQILRSDPFLAGRENRSRNLCDVYSYALLLPIAIVLNEVIVFLFFKLLFYLIRDGVQSKPERHDRGMFRGNSH